MRICLFLHWLAGQHRSGRFGTGRANECHSSGDVLRVHALPPPLRRPSGRFVHGARYFGAREVSLQPARTPRTVRRLVSGRTTADPYGRPPTRFVGAGRSTKSRGRNFEQAGAGPSLYIGSFGRVRCDRLDGGCLLNADALSPTSQIQLPGFKENAMRFSRKRALIIAGLSVLAAAPQYAADMRHLTLTEAVHLAVAQNRALKIARLKVLENEQKKAGERSGYFPALTNQSNVLHITELQQLDIPAGAFGGVNGTAIPPQGLSLGQGKKTFVSSGTMLAQPLTQLVRVHAQNRIAAAEVATSRNELKRAENQVAIQVHTLYYGILIARLQKQAAEQQAAYAGELLRESEDDIRNGSALKVAAIDGRAGLLQGQQAMLTAELQLSDLTAELNDLLGLPLDTQLVLDPAVPAHAALP